MLPWVFMDSIVDPITGIFRNAIAPAPGPICRRAARQAISGSDERGRFEQQPETSPAPDRNCLRFQQMIERNQTTTQE